MKLTTKQIKQLIKEELSNMIYEQATQAKQVADDLLTKHEEEIGNKVLNYIHSEAAYDIEAALRTQLNHMEPSFWLYFKYGTSDARVMDMPIDGPGAEFSDKVAMEMARSELAEGILEYCEGYLALKLLEKDGRIEEPKLLVLLKDRNPESMKQALEIFLSINQNAPQTIQDILSSHGYKRKK